MSITNIYQKAIKEESDDSVKQRVQKQQDLRDAELSDYNQRVEWLRSDATRKFLKTIETAKSEILSKAMTNALRDDNVLRTDKLLLVVNVLDKVIFAADTGEFDPNIFGEVDNTTTAKQ